MTRTTKHLTSRMIAVLPAAECYSAANSAIPKLGKRDISPLRRISSANESAEQGIVSRLAGSIGGRAAAAMDPDALGCPDKGLHQNDDLRGHLSWIFLDTKKSKNAQSARKGRKE